MALRHSWIVYVLSAGKRYNGCMSGTSEDIQKAWKAALKARLNAHAPYSRFKVGAALQLEGVPDAVVGCNVENASYGGTICAERVAITQAVARFGKIRPQFLVVVTDEIQSTVPCGLCLQALAEFAGDDLPIHLGNDKGLQKTLLLRDLLPQAFRSFQVKTP